MRRRKAGESRGESRVCPAVTALLLGLLLIAGPVFGSLLPQRMVQVELVNLGEGVGRDSPFIIDRFASVSFTRNRFRFGAAATEGFAEGWTASANTVLQAHDGYYLLANPRRTAFFYSLLPSCLAEVAAGPHFNGATWRLDGAYLRVSLASQIEYYGLGLGIEIGTYDLFGGSANERYYFTGPPHAFGAIQLRLLTASFEK